MFNPPANARNVMRTQMADGTVRTTWTENGMGYSHHEAPPPATTNKLTTTNDRSRTLPKVEPLPMPSLNQEETGDEDEGEDQPIPGLMEDVGPEQVRADLAALAEEWSRPLRGLEVEPLEQPPTL